MLIVWDRGWAMFEHNTQQWWYGGFPTCFLPPEGLWTDASSGRPCCGSEWRLLQRWAAEPPAKSSRQTPAQILFHQQQRIHARQRQIIYLLDDSGWIYLSIYLWSCVTWGDDGGCIDHLSKHAVNNGRTASWLPERIREQRPGLMNKKNSKIMVMAHHLMLQTIPTNSHRYNRT